MMTTKILRSDTWLRALFLALVACIAFCDIAYANDDVAIKKVFLSFDKISFGDSILAPWRIVQAKTWKEALATKQSILKGMSNDASEVKLSVAQRETLYKAWQKTPQEIWVIYFSQPDHLELEAIDGSYQIRLIASVSDAEQAQRDASEKAYNAGQKPLSPATYTQAGFDAKPFAKDFANWQQRFTQDIAEFDANMRKDRDFGKKLFADKNPESLKKAFGQSIDTGKKGLSLRGELISAYYAAPGHEGTEVTPSGNVFTKLVLSKLAKPVGFGGTFGDENTPVELWYMVFDDMTGWTVQDFNDSIVFETFKQEVNPPSPDAAAPAAGIEAAPKVYQSTELPPYKTTKRNSWPALVFTREADGKIMLYGMSMEMATILGNIRNKQLF
jgi:hypothetical protein